MQRMGCASFHRSARGHKGLTDHLPTKNPLPSRIGALATKQIFFELFKIEDRQQVFDGRTHQYLLGVGAILVQFAAIYHPE